MVSRSFTEITHQVLQYISSSDEHGATTTMIMYGAYLSYSQAKLFLNFLQKKQLVKRQSRESPRYVLTRKGIHFLRTSDGIRELVATDYKGSS